MLLVFTIHRKAACTCVAVSGPIKKQNKETVPNLPKSCNPGDSKEQKLNHKEKRLHESTGQYNKHS